MDIKVTPEWIRPLIPTTVYIRDRENYRIGDAVELLLDKIAKENTDV